MRLALTGATGFIGRRLLRHIDEANARGAPPIALRLHRRRDVAFHAPASVIETSDGSLEARDTWARLLEGCDAVVHIAGVVRGLGPEDFALNHRAVEAMVAARATRHDAPPALLVSSLAARRPTISDYAASKARAEAMFAQAGGVTAVVRPPAVYGPGDVEMLPLLRVMAAGIGVYPGDLDARVSVIHVDDLCRFLLAWVRTPRAGGPFEPDDGRTGGYRWRDLHDAVASVTRRQVRPLRLAPSLLRAVGHALVGIARLGGPVPMITPAKVRELTAPEWVCTPMEPIDDWRPTVPLARGLSALLRPNADGGAGSGTVSRADAGPADPILG